MKKKFALLLLVLVLAFTLAGCDDEVINGITVNQMTTSIVGKVGNVNTDGNLFNVKAYSAGNTNTLVATAQADRTGYFSFNTLQPGAYVLRIEVVGNGSSLRYEYNNPYDYQEKPVGVVQVRSGNVTNVGVIFTGLSDLNYYKAYTGVQVISGNIY